MKDKTTRLLAHERNIDRYQVLLKSSLSEIELRFVERRLSEERFALAMLQFMSPSNSMGDGHRDNVTPILRPKKAASVT
jgi:hypothetical protein